MSTRPFLRRGPSGPLADGGLVQVGYDEIIQSIVLPDDDAIVPRNAAGDPLRVELPSVTPGNYLEVDYRLNFQNVLEYYYTDPFEVQFAALITFDGTEPALDPLGPTTLLIVNSGSSIKLPPLGQDVGFGANANGLAGVIIPADATSAIVELLYGGGPLRFEIEDDPEEVEPGENSGTLKVSEIGQGSVTQPGPGVAVTPDL
jgi:hypothetical protein